MAEGKASFLLYADLLHTVEKMPDANAGQLFKTILQYVNDKDPQPEDLLLQLVFEPIKQQLKRDLKSYESTKEDRSRNGRIGNLKRWNHDLYQQVQAKKITLEDAENIANSRKASPPYSQQSPTIANIADNVNDTVNDSVIKEKVKKEIPLLSDVGQELLKKIMIWFGFTETANFDKMRAIADFLKCLMVQEKESYFREQFEAYTEFKTIDPKFKHNFSNFIGDAGHLYQNGKWNAENWHQKLKEEISKKSTGETGKKGKAESVLNAQSQMANYWASQSQNS